MAVGTCYSAEVVLPKLCTDETQDGGAGTSAQCLEEGVTQSHPILQLTEHWAAGATSSSMISGGVTQRMGFVTWPWNMCSCYPTQHKNCPVRVSACVRSPELICLLGTGKLSGEHSKIPSVKQRIRINSIQQTVLLISPKQSHRHAAWEALASSLHVVFHLCTRSVLGRTHTNIILSSVMGEMGIPKSTHGRRHDWEIKVHF